MNSARQDAWTRDEDIMLAEIVLRYIRDGNTQLEAFKEVGKKLSRTPAACGFRWNASIRKQYQDAIRSAKEERKNEGKKTWNQTGPKAYEEKDTIDTAISLLEKMKVNFSPESKTSQNELEKMVKELEDENDQLKMQLLRYEDAWREMGNLWKWVHTPNSD